MTTCFYPALPSYKLYLNDISSVKPSLHLHQPLARCNFSSAAAFQQQLASTSFIGGFVIFWSMFVISMQLSSSLMVMMTIRAATISLRAHCALSTVQARACVLQSLYKASILSISQMSKRV